MKFSSIILASALVLGAAAPSFAGGISNEIIRRNTRGHSDLSVSSQSVSDLTRVSRESYSKIDAVGEEATARLRLDRDGSVYGSGFASNVENPDPFVVVGQTSTRTVEQVSTTTDTNFNAWESYSESSVKYELGGY